MKKLILFVVSTAFVASIYAAGDDGCCPATAAQSCCPAKAKQQTKLTQPTAATSDQTVKTCGSKATKACASETAKTSTSCSMSAKASIDKPSCASCSKCGDATKTAKKAPARQQVLMSPRAMSLASR